MMRLRKHISHDLGDYYSSVLREDTNSIISGEGRSTAFFVILFGLLMVGGIIVHHYR